MDAASAAVVVILSSYIVTAYESWNNSRSGYGYTMMPIVAILSLQRHTL
jgi:hypothetical protein